MIDDSRIQQLLDEVFESGRPPEDVCSDCPDLLSLVRERWEQMCHLEAELGAQFPTPHAGPDLNTTAGQNLGRGEPRESRFGLV
jgi:serine/threonine-protein kinase